MIFWQEEFHFAPRDCETKEELILIVNPPAYGNPEETQLRYTECTVCNRQYVYSSSSYERELIPGWKHIWTKWHKNEVREKVVKT